MLNKDGREAALRVTRPLPEEVATERAQALMPLADHEMNRMAVMLFPYRVQKDYSSRVLGGGGGIEGKGMTRGGNVGGASIGAGATGIFGVGKCQKDIFGDRFVPETDGQPVIYSVRLLTAQRDPDAVSV